MREGRNPAPDILRPCPLSEPWNHAYDPVSILGISLSAEAFCSGRRPWHTDVRAVPRTLHDVPVADEISGFMIPMRPLSA